MRGGTYLVDELETFLVGHALVGELNRVEREGGGRVEGDHAGHEEGRSLRERDRSEGEKSQRWCLEGFVSPTGASRIAGARRHHARAARQFGWFPVDTLAWLRLRPKHRVFDARERAIAGVTGTRATC